MQPNPNKRSHTTTDPDILLKRRQDRQKASEKLQLRLDEQGIKRNEVENNLNFSTIPQVLLINQKNYFTEYLKRDENLRIVRNSRDKINKSLKIKQVNGSIELLKKSETISGAGNITETEDDDDENNLNENRTIVIHPGSHDIKIGWADDVDPIIIPNIIGYAKDNYNGKSNNEKRDKFDVNGLYPERIFVKGDKAEDDDDDDENDDNNENDNENDNDEDYDDDDNEKEKIGKDGKKVKSYFALKDEKEFKDKCKPIIKSYKERMRYYKHRILPNCHSACFKFNRKQQYETNNLENIGDEEEFSNEGVENDSYNDKNMFIESSKWIKEMGRKYVIGDEVFRLKDEEEWIIRRPFLFNCIKDGEEGKESQVEIGFNEYDDNYNSKEELLGDIEIMFRHILKNKFNITKNEEFNKVNIMFVIPSLYRKTYVEDMIELFFNKFRFKNVSFIQDGLSASFGLGVSTGCIVDIGSNNIHICCVDEGMIVEDSRIVLNYGLNDVIKFWCKLLIQQQFPKININLNKLKDWKLIENLFFEHCTFNDNKTGVIQVGNLLEYESNKSARRYKFKIFDENMISCMGMFYPEVFNENKEDSVSKGRLFKGDSYEFTGYNNSEPLSILQEIQSRGISIVDKNDEDIIKFLHEINEVSNSNNNRRENIEEFLKKLFENVKEKEEKNIKNITPLDIAIIESITIAGINSGNDNSKLDKFYSNICVIGGGGKIEGIENILIDRIHIERNEILSNIGFVNAVKKGSMEEIIMGDNDGNGNGSNNININTNTNATVDVTAGMSSGEADSRTAGWKGGCVFARLKVAEELIISDEDWELLGARSLTYGCVFSY